MRLLEILQRGQDTVLVAGNGCFYWLAVAERTGKVTIEKLSVTKEEDL